MLTGGRPGAPELLLDPVIQVFTCQAIENIMRTRLLALIVSTALMVACHRPTAPSDTDQQQGNAQAQPEKSATSSDSKQPRDDQAGKDAHTAKPNRPERQ